MGNEEWRVFLFFFFNFHVLSCRESDRTMGNVFTIKGRQVNKLGSEDKSQGESNGDRRIEALITDTSTPIRSKNRVSQPYSFALVS